MKKEQKALATLAEVEREVVAEYRELGRRRLEQRLQQLADQTGEVFPPAPAQISATDAADRIGAGEADRDLRPESTHAKMVLSPAASLGTGAASKDHTWPGRKALLHGRRDPVL